MNHKIWIGKYESEVADKNLFLHTITIYGSNKDSNFSFLEERGEKLLSYDDFINFIIDKINKIIINKTNCKFYFYNEKWGYDILQMMPDLRKFLVLKNEKSFLDFLNKKIYSRCCFSNNVCFPPFFFLNKIDCKYQELLNSFEGYETFIIQKAISEGGEGTFILKKDDCDIYNHLEENVPYIISPFYSNSFSLNITIICNEESCICFPISEQLFNEKNIFIGSDFISGNEIYINHKNLIKNFINSIVECLQKNHYIGLCGIDFLINNEKIYFIEFNPRFQGSTFLINYFLYNNNQLTVHKLYLDLLEGKKLDTALEKMIELQIDQSWCFNKINHKKVIRTLNDGNKIITYKHIYEESISATKIEHSTNSYYDYFATRYKYIMSDYEYKISTEGKLLAQLFNQYSNRPVHSVLDCTCGIGVQTISLAQIGFDVYGTDISSGEIEVAKTETLRHNLHITYKVADCRNLENAFTRKFDAIISIDSALTHLLDEENMYCALHSIYERLEYGGIFIASFRDYDKMIEEKPAWAYPTRYRKTENGYAIILRHFDWNVDKCTSSQFYIEVEDQKEPKLFYSTYKQWAITREKLLSISKKLPFSNSFWLFPDKTRFYQPIFCALK